MDEQQTTLDGFTETAAPNKKGRKTKTGTVSLPFEPGDNRKVAVKIVDDRGIESLKIIPLED
jgi:hypothetical protein